MFDISLQLSVEKFERWQFCLDLRMDETNGLDKNSLQTFLGQKTESLVVTVSKLK